MISTLDRKFDDDWYEELDENSRYINPDEEDRPYFPPEESEPPHY